jgi:DNA polymerase/3'-5' exonuclease PolX
MEFKVMLAKNFEIDMKIPKELINCPPPVNWKASEKLDGLRALWDSKKKKFISRNKNEYYCPEWYKNGISKCIPSVNADGELWIGRNPVDFEGMGVARKKIPVDEDWIKIKYCIYDFPELEYNFSDRYKIMKQNEKIIKENWNIYRLTLNKKFHKIPCPIIILEQITIKSIEHMTNFYEKVLEKKGEGIMLKHPNSKYEDKRSNYLLKYKPVSDSEAVIIGYKEGKGKYKGLLGAFFCKPLINKGNYQIINDDRKMEFSISGMDDSIRNSYKETHQIGTIITYTYNGFTSSGKARFPRFMRIRDDVIIKNNHIKSTEIIKKCIEIFTKLSLNEKANGRNFKSSAYNKAIEQFKTIEDDSELVPDKLIKLNGIGKSIIEKTMNIVSTGTCPQYEDIKEIKDPKELFMEIHGVGSVKAKQLVGIGFKTIEDIRNCDSIENYLNETQLKGLKYYEDIKKKIPYLEIYKHEKVLKLILKDIDSTAELSIAGSFRRGKETSGDIDVLIKTPSVKNTQIYEKFLDKLNESYMIETLSRGKKKFMGICKLSNICRRIDIMFTKPEEYPFAILYFTGSKEFNVKMRSELLEKNLSLNEYGIKNTETNKMIKHGCKTEEEVFKYLKYDYIHPHER